LGQYFPGICFDVPYFVGHATRIYEYQCLVF